MLIKCLTNNYTMLFDITESYLLTHGKDTHDGVGIPVAKHGNMKVSFSRKCKYFGGFTVMRGGTVP